MKSTACALAFGMFLSFPVLILAGSFQVYPGAKLQDIYETGQTGAGAKMTKGPKVIVFTTSDPFENVVAFYRGIGREYRMRGPGGPTKLSSGQKLEEAYFIFDGSGDIATSKHWIKIQRPYLSRERTKEGLQGKYGAVREVTAIIEEDRRAYP